MNATNSVTKGEDYDDDEDTREDDAAYRFSDLPEISFVNIIFRFSKRMVFSLSLFAKTSFEISIQPSCEVLFGHKHRRRTRREDSGEAAQGCCTQNCREFQCFVHL